MTAVLFAVAAALGGCCRHTVNRAGWGWAGTLAVNVAGAFVLGWLVGGDHAATTLTVVGTGFCGSLTTFSTLSLEATTGPPGRRIAVITTNLALGLLAATLGATR